MPNLLLRDATPDEALALEAIQRRSSAVWEDDRALLEAHPDMIEPPHEAIAEGLVRIAVGDAGRIVGFAVALPVEHEGRWELDDLFVEPDQMRYGIGRALVDDVIARAAATGATHLDVTANTNALGFYTRLGFQVVGETATRFGKAPRMTLDLARSG